MSGIRGQRPEGGTSYLEMRAAFTAVRLGVDYDRVLSALSEWHPMSDVEQRRWVRRVPLTERVDA